MPRSSAFDGASRLIRRHSRRVPHHEQRLMRAMGVNSRSSVGCVINDLHGLR